MDIYSTLSEYTKNITVYDPWANAQKLTMNMVLFLQEVLWKSYTGNLILSFWVWLMILLEMKIPSFLRNMNGVVYDVKGILNREMIDGRL